jgi:hypothetical protein
MATKYIHRCPNQSYAITLEMCAARQTKNVPKCANCRNKPQGAQSCQGRAVA